MALTFKRLMFAKHFAKNPDRQQAVISAGFAPTAWKRTAVRLLQSAEVLAAVQREQEKELKRQRAGKMTRSDVVSELVAMLETANGMPSRAGWSSRLRVLEVLARVLDKREEAQPGEEAKPLSTAELEKRIAELTAQLHVKEPEGNRETTTIAPQTVSDVPQPQPSATDAPESPPSAIAEAPAPKPKPPVINNMMPTTPDEREQLCGRHGGYLSTRRGRVWSYCPGCEQEWRADDKWLRGLMPAGK